MTYLVDSDWIADYLKGRRAAIVLLDRLAPEGLAISILSFGEIQEGIIFGDNRRRHDEGFRNFLRGVRVLTLTRSVMRRFAAIRGTLRSQGQIIGDMDLLIAATAIDHDLALVSRNTRHFSRVPGLKLYGSA